ncbi:MAG: hypothetical protein H7A41_03100 [Chlamydiales bacterium]|nr:hypothetical protein [Chlamydiales bacterium]
MSEISTVGGDSSIQAEALGSEGLTKDQVAELFIDAKIEIIDQNFDRAREIITRLSLVHHQAQAPKGWVDTFCGWISGSECPVTIGDLYELFFTLCNENCEEGKKLIPILSKNFSIEVDGNHYKVSSGEFSESFTVPIRTSPEAKALIEHLRKLNGSRKYEDLKKELPYLAQLCAEQKVALSNFEEFYEDLVFLNSSFALSCFPIFINVYLMWVEDDRLCIQSYQPKEFSSFWSGHLSLVDCDRNLERIAKIENPLERLWKYYFLARHQMERAPEVIRKAEEQLDLLKDSRKRFSGLSTIMSWYCNNHDHMNFERIATKFEKELLDDQEISHYYLAEIHYYRASSCLEKKDHSGYVKSTEKLVQEMKQVKEEAAIESLQRNLRNLKSKEAETFPVNQMEWQAMRA